MGRIKNALKVAATTSRVAINNPAERKRIIDKTEKNGINNIPIFIINFNRLECLKALVKRLEQLNLTNINIIDNASTYGPLLEYYDATPHNVIRLKKNWGHRVFWECPDFEKDRKSFYVLTDSDVVPTEDCSADFMKEFFRLLKKYPRLERVGFSLKIDDLPEDGIFTDEVIGWESQFYSIFLKAENAYLANIDTTFAMYAPQNIVTKTASYSSMRTGYPLEARHLPWYKREGEITEEDVYYSEHKSNGWWNVEAGTVTPDTDEEKRELEKAILEHKNGQY